MQYGYTGPISALWRSQNASDAATLAQAMATKVLIWETVVGERDEDFNHISPGSYDAVKSVISTAHPLYSQFISYYNSIEASVQRHSAIPSFMPVTGLSRPAPVLYHLPISFPRTRNSTS